jgi:hypothetical protein
VRQPYKWDQLSETAKHREILNIYARASPRARHFYDKAHYRTPVRQGEFIEENWAIRWFLWHSFRYRDNRDHRAARDTSGGGGGVGQASAGENIDARRAQLEAVRGNLDRALTLGRKTTVLGCDPRSMGILLLNQQTLFESVSFAVKNREGNAPQLHRRT